MLKLFLTKTNINFHIFNLPLHWRPSLLRTIRGIVSYGSKRSMNNNFTIFHFGFPINIKSNSFVSDTLLTIDGQFVLYYDISLLILVE